MTVQRLLVARTLASRRESAVATAVGAGSGAVRWPVTTGGSKYRASAAVHEANQAGLTSSSTCTAGPESASTNSITATMVKITEATTMASFIPASVVRDLDFLLR